MSKGSSGISGGSTGGLFVKPCIDGTNKHKFEAFVFENMDVLERCTICEEEFLHKFTGYTQSANFKNNG